MEHFGSEGIQEQIGRSPEFEIKKIQIAPGVLQLTLEAFAVV